MSAWWTVDAAGQEKNAPGRIGTATRAGEAQTTRKLDRRSSNDTRVARPESRACGMEDQRN